MKLKLAARRTLQWITNMIERHKWNYKTKHTNYEYSTINYNHDSKTQVKLWNYTYQLWIQYYQLQSWKEYTSETMKLNIPSRRTVQWITNMIARHKWNYETKIPTMRTVQWITILIARQKWNYETKHTN